MIEPLFKGTEVKSVFVSLLCLLEMPPMWFQTRTLLQGTKALACHVGTAKSLYPPRVYRHASVFAQASFFFFFFFFFKHYFHGEPHQNLPAKQSSLLMHRRRMLMKPKSSGRARSGFCGCVISGKERPLCPRGMFESALCGLRVRAGAALHRANLFSLYSLRITAPVSSVPSASTSRWAMSWRPRRRTASTWLWCALTW